MSVCVCVHACVYVACARVYMRVCLCDYVRVLVVAKKEESVSGGFELGTLRCTELRTTT